MFLKMQGHIILAALLVITSGAIIPEDGNPKHLEARADVIYHFFSQNNPDNGVEISGDVRAAMRKTSFDVKKDTLFIVHGWKGNNDSDFTNDIRNQILELTDINVFVVDWTPLAGQDYRAARRTVVETGETVAKFVKELKKKFKLKLSQVKFVGWSLGAHVSGNAGAALGGQVDRITGLDPAGPLFSASNIKDRLDPTDAKFVQVIHTSGTLGINIPCGHADYYPNGGSDQPGCFPDILGGKSHARVFSLYVESLHSNKFVATKCNSWNDYKRKRCNKNEKSVMGGFVPDYEARGTYYLKTNSRSPFAQG